jgi:hypothetical protein
VTIGSVADPVRAIKASLHLEADFVDNRFPLARLLIQRCGELQWSSNPCLHADGIQAGAELCRPQSVVYGAVELLVDAGVPAGASRPNMTSGGKPDTPTSCMVGVCGS